MTPGRNGRQCRRLKSRRGLLQRSPPGDHGGDGDDGGGAQDDEGEEYPGDNHNQ